MWIETNLDATMTNRGSSVVAFPKAKAAKCAACPVRQTAICRGLSDESLPDVSCLSHSREIARGTTVVWAGDRNPSCSIVVSGMLKVTASTVDGREQIVGLLYPGDCIGQPYSDAAEHSVTALTAVKLCSFSRRNFEKVLEHHPAVAQRFLRHTLVELNQSRDWMLLLGQRSAQEKVATFIVDIARKLTTEAGISCLESGEAFDLPLSRQQIADILGLTIETVSRQMTRLKTTGVIQLLGPRTVRVLRHDLLEQLADAA